MAPTPHPAAGVHDDFEFNIADSEECMLSLEINLLIIFGQRLVVGTLTEVVLPYIAYKKKRKELEKQAQAGNDWKRSGQVVCPLPPLPLPLSLSPSPFSLSCSIFSLLVSASASVKS